MMENSNEVLLDEMYINSYQTHHHGDVMVVVIIIVEGNKLKMATCSIA